MAEEGRAKSDRLETNVKPGMTKAEVESALGGEKIGNCRGNPATTETCELQFLTSEPRYFNTAPKVPSTPATGPSGTGAVEGDSGYSAYNLVFEKGRLKLWERAFVRERKHER
jgi:hypothetical protein